MPGKWKKSPPTLIASRALRFCGVTLLLMAALSCVRSLAPLFEDDDLVFDPRLLGSWTSGAGEEIWAFERAGEKEYRLTCRGGENEAEASFRGRLGRLGGACFLDLFPDKGEVKRPPNGLLAMHLVPAHTFWRVRFEGGLALDPFSPDWIKEALGSGRLKIAHVTTPDEIILTADTAALQSLLAGLADDREAFPPSSEPLRRLKGDQP